MRSCVFNYRFRMHRDIYVHRHTHRPAVLLFINSLQINSKMTLFMICNLCQLSDRPPLTSPLISSALCLCLPLHAFSVKQWLFPVKKNWFCQVLKRGGDKWREGMRGCKDNSLLWWLTFQCGVSNESMIVLLWIHWRHNDWRSQDQFHPSGW